MKHIDLVERITDNRNGKNSYNPAKSFVGINTFTYTLCDRENTPNCSTATVTITIEDQGTPKALDVDRTQ